MEMYLKVASNFVQFCKINKIFEEFSSQKCNRVLIENYLKYSLIQQSIKVAQMYTIQLYPGSQFSQNGSKLFRFSTTARSDNVKMIGGRLQNEKKNPKHEI